METNDDLTQTKTFKSMKLLFIVFSFLFCVSCNKMTNKETSTNQRPSDVQIKIDTVYNRDKNHIADAYIDNVEAIRISRRNKAQHTQYKDPANIYLPYAVRYNTQSMKYEGSPLPTSEQISVNTDTIVYSPDSLLCVALVSIDNHFADIPPYEPERVRSGKYDGRALIGYRNNLRNQFNIYPFDIYTVIGFDNPEIVKNILMNYYFYGIVGKTGPSGSNIEGMEYTCGIGDPKFFDNAPNFLKNNGKYRFESYREGNTEIPYVYHSNK